MSIFITTGVVPGDVIKQYKTFKAATTPSVCMRPSRATWDLAFYKVELKRVCTILGITPPNWISYRLERSTSTSDLMTITDVVHSTDDHRVTPSDDYVVISSNDSK